MANAKLVEKRKELEEKHKLIKTVFDQGRQEGSADYDFTKVTALEGTTEEKVAKLQEMNKSLEGLVAEVTQLELADIEERTKARTRDLERAVPLPGGGGGGEPSRRDVAEQPTLGELFTQSTAYKRFIESKQRSDFGAVVGGAGEISLQTMGLKTLMQTTAGWAPRPTRIDRVVGIAERPPQIIDYIPSVQFDQPSVIYMEETTATHSAAELAEAGTYPESAFVLTERTSTVRKVADSLPVTDEQLADIPQVRAWLDGRLTFGLRQRIDLQLMLGNGTAPNLLGVANAAGIQTQARSTDPHFDCAMKALVLVRTTGRASPNLIVYHPTDWQTIKLTRTADGIYILGNPSEPGPNTLWGVPVALFEGGSAGTGYVGDFANYSQLFERKGIEVQAGFTGTQFTEGKVTLRADARVALAIYRGAAFCKMTGL